MRAAVEAWVEAPLAAFVDEARVRLALVLESSGRVVAQHGFTRSLDVMSACALAAAIGASSDELGRQLDGAPFGALHHGGDGRQLFLGRVETRRGRLLVLAVFDDGSSLGLVRLYWQAFQRALADRAPAPVAAERPALAADFEQDLDRNLALLFGRI